MNGYDPNWRSQALAAGIDQNSPQFDQYRAYEASLKGGGGGNQAMPAFNFDWTKARQDALDQLTPYYNQKLADAKGDVELAKKYIEQDYQRGTRYNTEDLGVAQSKQTLDTARAAEDYTRTMTNTNEDLTAQMAQENLNNQVETRNTVGEANNRGVYVGEMQPGQESAKAPVSDYAQNYILSPMTQNQALRKQAIQRAISRQQEVAGITQTRSNQDTNTSFDATQRALTRSNEGLQTTEQRGLAAQDLQFPRTQADLEEQKRQEAFNQVAPMNYQEELTKYRAANQLPS